MTGSDHDKRRRSSMGPVVLFGLATAGFSAVAGNQRWAEPGGTTDVAFAPVAQGAQVPLAPALSLALLAIWGLLLVLRGKGRRVMAMLGVLLGLVTLGTVIAGRSSLIHDYDILFTQMGIDRYSVHFTGWYWLALALSALAVVAFAIAVTQARTWPEMGSKYDAPTARPVEDDPTSTDLWKSIDEGRDPTA